MAALGAAAFVPPALSAPVGAEPSAAAAATPPPTPANLERAPSGAPAPPPSGTGIETGEAGAPPAPSVGEPPVFVVPGSPPAAAPARPTPAPGHTRAIAVPAVGAAPIIDGKVDEDVWDGAPVAADFWISEYGRAPQEATDVRVIADRDALYFAFTCKDSRPEQIHAEQLKRDGSLGIDDHVIIDLDPYHNHRQISQFSVNARGTQSDAMAGGRARNIAWKGDWQAAAQRTPTGWTAEMRIPFSILNYQPGATTFGINFARYHSRTQEWSRWADLTPQNLPEEAGHLSGLVLPKIPQKAQQFKVLQYAVAGSNTVNRKGEMQSAVANTGLDLRYDIANNLSNVLSVNPDFSQVEDAVVGLGFDYNEKFRRDNRPFFQEGSAFFPGTQYFHSGRVPSFDVGFKSFGKTGPLQMGLLGTQAPGGRKDYVARAVREIGPTLSAGLTLVGTRQSSLDNRLVAFDVGGRLNRTLHFGANLASTSTQGQAGDGSRMSLSTSYNTAYWQAGIGADRTDVGFFPANGFIAADVLGTRSYSAFFNYGREFDGAALRRVNASVSYGERDTLTGLSQSRSLSVYAGGDTRSNVSFNLGMTVGPYRPRGASPGEWSEQVNRDRFYSVSTYFDTMSDRRGYGVTYSWGNLGGGRYSNLSPSFWFRPSRRTYVSYSHETAESFGVSRQGVLNLSWEVDPQHSVSLQSVRARGAYEDNWLRVAFRRQVRSGVDVFAVYNKDSYSKASFSLKLVRTLF